MSEKKIWLSETKLEMATTAIIIGTIDSNILNECKSIYKSDYFLSHQMIILKMTPFKISKS